jgi:hypothetical protein
LDKGRAANILAGYSPPLSTSQIDAIVEEIVKISEKEIVEAVKKAKLKGKKK